ncbi:MAG: hypothetical protein OES47_13800 [Acidobacteriota bacterium]|nr:hypothetical protein [Acidobacteriota bacterium]
MSSLWASHSGRLLLSVLLVAGFAAVTVLAAQEEPAFDELTTPVEPLDDELGAADLSDPEGYTYDSGGRRDPFRSLLSVRRRPEAAGPRPDGIPGLLIDEIDVNGIWTLADGAVAQIRSTQQEQSYLLREGDQLYDGDVVSIGDEEVVFKQIVDDPTAIKPFHEVVKKLNP